MRKRSAFIVILASALLVAGGWTYGVTARRADVPRPLAASPAPAAESVPAVAAAAPAAERKTIRVLIVPGHEPGAGGTRSGGTYERDLAVELGDDLGGYLRADPRYEVTITRDAGSWTPTFAEYFKDHGAEVDAWRRQAHAAMAGRLAAGEITLPAVTVDHPAASSGAAARLFGITKWANDHGVDVMIHVHFNDDRMTSWTRGTRSGFAMYVPVPEYKNGAASRAIATDVFKRLAALNPVSDFAPEAGGIIDDSQLIALGQDDTADVPSILIEYGYIYERQFGDRRVRALAMKDLAYQTYLGLQDHFGEDEPGVSGTAVLPYAWRAPMTRGGADPKDVYALQTALILDGDAVPSGGAKVACPRNGLFDACTREALKRFQKKYGITGEDGFAGKKTLQKLNAP